MSLKTVLAKNRLYFLAVAVMTTGLYFICDYYLATISKEIMNSFAESESVAIQEGNLLSSITKTQRFLMSSEYIKGIRLVSHDKLNKIHLEYESGRAFDINANELQKLNSEITSQSVGLLHRNTFYKIPNKPNMVLVFDAHSNALSFLFFLSVSLIVLIISYVIWSLRRNEQIESKKREQILKLAISDLVASGEMPSILEKEIPTLTNWYKIKKSELLSSQNVAIEQQSKIRLGEIASKAVHDIRGAVRNIRQMAKLASGLNAEQQQIVENSINKITDISQNILKSTKDIYETESLKKEEITLNDMLQKIVTEKQAEFSDCVQINLEILDTNLTATLDQNQLTRSLDNLINNAIEATNSERPALSLKLSKQEQQAVIQIIDSGVGISPENLPQVGAKGFTFGKTDGTGLGVYSAKRYIEDIGGRFIVDSKLGHGTTVSLFIPLLHKEYRQHLPESHQITADKHILILEDQPLIQKTIQMKFKDAKMTSDRYTILSTPSDLENWMATHKFDFKLYSDYFLENEHSQQLENGASVIQRLGLKEKSVLITSAFDNAEVIAHAKIVGVSVLSKDDFLNTQVRMG